MRLLALALAIRLTVYSLPVARQVLLQPPASSGGVVVNLTILHANCAPFVAAHPASDLCFPVSGPRSVNVLLLLLPEPCAQYRERRLLVSELRPLGLAADHQFRWAVDQRHGRFGAVHALPAGTGGATDRPFQILFTNYERGFDGLRQHGDGDGAGVDAPAFFGGRDTLPAMASGFISECVAGGCASDLQGHGAGAFVYDFGVKDISGRSVSDTTAPDRARDPWHRCHLQPPEFQ